MVLLDRLDDLFVNAGACVRKVSSVNPGPVKSDAVLQTFRRSFKIDGSVCITLAGPDRHSIFTQWHRI